MSDRGTSNVPNTRNPECPPSKPSRLEQFADDIFVDKEEQIGLEVISRKEKKNLK